MPKVGTNVMMNRFCKMVPDYNKPSHFMVGVTTADPAWSDTTLNDAVTISGTSNNKLLHSTTLNETDAEVVFRGRLTTTEANSNTLTGFAVMNDDTTPKLITKSKFTGIAKTNTMLIKFNVKLKLQDSEAYTP